MATTGLKLAAPISAESIRGEIMSTFSDARRWLDTPHALLGGSTPEECLSNGEWERVADLFYSILYIGIT